MNTVGIIGFGRFGETLAQLLLPEYKIKVFDVQAIESALPVQACSLEEVLESSTLFIAVPISHFESLIKEIAPKLKPNSTIIDVCSVKVHPTKIMQQYLPEQVDIIATHPLFGPDSIKANSPLKMMMHPVRNQSKHYAKWKEHFAHKDIQILEMTPDEHDQFAARSQGITHFIGRVLGDVGLEQTPIDTLGFIKLREIIEVTCNDTWELFCDLQKYNPYTKEVLAQLADSIQNIQSCLD